MKFFWTAIFTAGLFVSCAEEFNYSNPAIFNTQVEYDMNLTSPKEVMMAYYNVDEIYSPANFTIDTKVLSADRFEVTLIETGMQDDSVEGQKVVMTVRKTATGWFVEEIKHNHRCWDERGHTNWGIQKCN